MPQAALGPTLSSRIVALDRPEADKTRPLAIGHFLRKYTNKSKTRVFKKRVVEIIGDTDYSLGGDHTAELMHKTVLADVDINEDYVLNKVDVSNAHNEFDRTEVLEMIQTEVPEMMPWLKSELCTETHHAHLGDSGEILWINKSMGGDQGDPIVALLPPLVLQSDKKQR